MASVSPPKPWERAGAGATSTGEFSFFPTARYPSNIVDLSFSSLGSVIRSQCDDFEYNIADHDKHCDEWVDCWLQLVGSRFAGAPEQSKLGRQSDRVNILAIWH